MGSRSQFAAFAAQPISQLATRELDFGQPPPPCRVCCPKLHSISNPRARFWAATPHFTAVAAQPIIQSASRGLGFGQSPPQRRVCCPTHHSISNPRARFWAAASTMPRLLPNTSFNSSKFLFCPTKSHSYGSVSIGII